MGRTTMVLVFSLLVGCGNAATPHASGPAAADALHVTCDGSTTEVLTPTVQAQPDGLHVRIENTSTGQVLMEWDGGGDGADPGISNKVIPIPPGNARFRCQASTPDVDPGALGGWATLEVLATPNWRSLELDCNGGIVSGNLDYAAGADGVPDPLADARRRAHTSDVRPAGYMTDQGRTFEALQGAAAVESFDYASDGHGGWLLTTTERCS